MPVQGRAPATSSVRSGRAVHVSVSPLATPMRRVPKSKARISSGEVIDFSWPRSRSLVGSDQSRQMRWHPISGGSSGVSRLGTDHGEIDAEQTARGVPSLFKRRVEDDAFIGLTRKPRVLSELLFKLARTPTCIAERDHSSVRADTA